MNNSVAGYNELQASIKKQSVETYVESLTFLINISIMQGAFPNDLKIVKVIPVFKG